jgi:3-oxoacyl-[acyl-carrier protein] reductase
LHVLVNIAGVYAPAPILEMSAEMFERVLRVHLYGTFFNIKAAVAHMVPQGYGRIVNTTSRAGLRGFPPGECNYSAAKMGIVGLTLALAWELSPQRITVNCVSPVAWTRTAEALPEVERKASWEARARNVLGRTGLPEDAAQTYAFLASDRAAYLTGQIVEATGEPMMLL